MKFLLSVLLTVSLAGYAQGDKENLDAAAGKLLVNLRAADNQEIFVHTDKDYYPLGATLWFRVFLVQAFSKLPLPSARVYVDLLDKNDRLVSRTMLNTASYEWDGGIRISPQWKEGLYKMRIFTEEMLLAPSIGSPLVKPLYFFSKSKTDAQPLTLVAKPSPGIAFFPEGGNLVNGLPNTIAFRSFDDHGDPIKGSGYLKDDRNQVIETFKVDGYGKFSFSPSKNRKYKLYITLSDKSERLFDLPPANDTGWQISVSKTTPATINLRIAQGDALYPLKPVSYLLGISNARLLFASMGRGVYEVSVPLKNFPAGAATFYLLDEKQQIVSTRQFTIRDTDLQVNIIPNKQNYAPRETVSVDLDLNDGTGHPLSALLSISVTDDRYNTPLTANPVATEISDITDPLHITPAKGSPVTDSTMQVSGNVSLPSGQPAAAQVVSLVSTPDDLLLTDTTDAQGNFNFRTPEFYDGKPFMIQVTDPKGAKLAAAVTTKPAEYNLQAPPTEIVPASKEPILSYIANQADSSLRGMSGKMIEALATTTPKNKSTRKADDNRNKFSRMITGEQLDKLQLGTTANAVMMIPGVIMMEGKLTIRGGMTGIVSGLSGIEPLIIIDGVPAGSTNVIDIINSIPPHLVDYIEVLAGGDAGMYGTRGANGVILIKTNTGPREQKIPPKDGLQYVYPPGYHQAPEFSMPKYNLPQVRSYNFVDNRSTIFWKGELLVDRSGKGKFSFYAADEPTTYTITVKGVSSKGDIIDKRVQIRR